MAKYLFTVLVVVFCLSSVLSQSFLTRRDGRLGPNIARSQASASASASSNTNGLGSSSANSQSSASSSTNGLGSSSANAQASAAAESISQRGQCFDECQSWENYCFCNYDNFCGSTVCRRSGNVLPRNPIIPRINRIRQRVPVCRRNTLSVLGACRRFDQCQYESDCPRSQTCCYDRTCGYNVCQYQRGRQFW